MRALARAPIYLYHLGLGGLLGERFLLLVHKGRMTGLKREVALELVRHDREENFYVVVSGWGDKADWCRNIVADPRVEIQVRGTRMHAVAEQANALQAGDELVRYGSENPRGLQGLAKIMGFQISQDPADYRALGEALPVFLIRVVQN